VNPGPWVVLKFGGTSVSTRARWETIAEVLRERIDQGFRPVLVCSALSGVSNLLDALAEQAAAGHPDDTLEQVRARHLAMAGELQIALPESCTLLLASLERWVTGARLLGDRSPRVRAAIMAMGELLSTRLGEAWLRERAGLQPAWVDARQWLQGLEPDDTAPARRWLQATCAWEPDQELQQAWAAMPGDVVLTQGFIARAAGGDTVLLGRGGSDTSASYFAARLQAARCEIWTDVPGMFTADPRLVPHARHLLRLDYDEAQEIATTGAKVLHPRCIAPCRAQRIPMEVRSTDHPQLRGTLIAAADHASSPGIKAISVKKGVTIVSMDTLGMWQQPGFLAEAFARFAALDLSIDLVSTSESNVSVTLDPTANALDPEVMDTLRQALAPLCRARIFGPCAAVSLVGSRVRAIFARLGPAFSLFEDMPIHLISQAASDLNLSFVVEQDDAARLVERLHALLFGDLQGKPAQRSGIFGTTWHALQAGDDDAPPVEARWWETCRETLLGIDLSERAAYVYDRTTVAGRAERLRAMTSLDRAFYATKANPHPALLQELERHGIGFECVSPGEINRVREALPHLPADRILFTPNFADIAEYRAAFALGVHVTLDNLHPLREHPEVFRDREVLVRVDPGQGRGHHRHVQTGGRGSKFGVDATELPELAARLQGAGCRAIGLHAHAGSGITSAVHWQQTALTLVAHAPLFGGSVRVLNLGGGLGVPDRPGAPSLDLADVDAALREFRQAHPGFDLWMEPGRWLVAQAGVLLARVTQTKTKGEAHYVGLQVGMNGLIRPALYGAFHDIINLTRWADEPAEFPMTVVGPICESGDTLGTERPLPVTREGDVMLIDTAGAYGFVMASHYNLRGLPAEVWLDRS
jgi:diaminopimelate decarboxylase/aspartate kinase